MAAENCLWGAPRIHGELLKLGIAISERTVSRYLRDRPTTRSQTWRTFFANHFGGQTFSLVMFADANDEAIAVDASDASLRPAPSIDASSTSIHGPTVDWGRSLQPSSLGVRLAQHHVQDRTITTANHEHLDDDPGDRRGMSGSRDSLVPRVRRCTRVPARPVLLRSTSCA